MRIPEKASVSNYAAARLSPKDVAGRYLDRETRFGAPCDLGAWPEEGEAPRSGQRGARSENPSPSSRHYFCSDRLAFGPIVDQ
jgi:hypothetical protein